MIPADIVYLIDVDKNNIYLVPIYLFPQRVLFLATNYIIATNLVKENVIEQTLILMNVIVKKKVSENH